MSLRRTKWSRLASWTQRMFYQAWEYFPATAFSSERPTQLYFQIMARSQSQPGTSLRCRWVQHHKYFQSIFIKYFCKHLAIDFFKSFPIMLCMKFISMFMILLLMQSIMFKISTRIFKEILEVSLSCKNFVNTFLL